MDAAEIPNRQSWKQNLAPYLAVDRTRSLAQLASVALPYLSVWVLAAIVRPGPLAAVALGVVATVFLIRMYSLFHDLTHNSLFESRAANAGWGHAARLPTVHAVSVVAAPAQPPPRPRRQPRPPRGR